MTARILDIGGADSPIDCFKGRVDFRNDWSLSVSLSRTASRCGPAAPRSGPGASSKLLPVCRCCWSPYPQTRCQWARASVVRPEFGSVHV